MELFHFSVSQYHADRVDDRIKQHYRLSGDKICRVHPCTVGPNYQECVQIVNSYEENEGNHSTPGPHMNSVLRSLQSIG